MLRDNVVDIHLDLLFLLLLLRALGGLYFLLGLRFLGLVTLQRSQELRKEAGALGPILLLGLSPAFGL